MAPSPTRQHTSFNGNVLSHGAYQFIAEANPIVALQEARATRLEAQRRMALRKQVARVEHAEMAGGAALSPRRLHPKAARAAVQRAQSRAELCLEAATKDCRAFTGSGRSYYDAPSEALKPPRSPSKSPPSSPEEEVQLQYPHHTSDCSRHPHVSPRCRCCISS